MKIIFKIFSALLLLFNGVGAIYGGWNLILHPDGSSLGMTTEYLQHSPFGDYLLPGIVLFTVNGLFSFFVLSVLFFRPRYFPRLLMVQGTVLIGWILMMMVQIIYYLHIITALAGLALILCGWTLIRIKKLVRPETIQPL